MKVGNWSIEWTSGSWRVIAFTAAVFSVKGSPARLAGCMRIRFADISQLLRVADPRSGARLCEAQHVQSMRMPINRIGMVQTSE